MKPSADLYPVFREVKLPCLGEGEFCSKVANLIPTGYKRIRKTTIRCQGCGGDFSRNEIEIDHIYPRSRGGIDHYSNYQYLCCSCNRSKSARTMREWVESGNLRCKAYWRGRHHLIPEGRFDVNLLIKRKKEEVLVSSVVYLPIDRSRVGDMIKLCDGRLGTIVDIKQYGIKVQISSYRSKAIVVVTDEEIVETVYSANALRKIKRLAKKVPHTPVPISDRVPAVLKVPNAPQFGRNRRALRSIIERINSEEMSR